MSSLVDNNGGFNTKPDTGFYTGGGLNQPKNPYEITVGKEKEDLSWLLG